MNRTKRALAARIDGRMRARPSPRRHGGAGVTGASLALALAMLTAGCAPRIMVPPQTPVAPPARTQAAPAPVVRATTPAPAAAVAPKPPVAGERTAEATPVPRVIVEPREPGWRRNLPPGTVVVPAMPGTSAATTTTNPPAPATNAPSAAAAPASSTVLPVAPARVVASPSSGTPSPGGPAAAVPAAPINETLPAPGPAVASFGKPESTPPAASVPVPPAPAAPAKAEEAGIATVYSNDIVGELTASGERYAPGELTAAHRTLPIGTVVRVVHVASGRAVKVRINDRWGGGNGRVINLSRRAADELGFGRSGQLTVELFVETIGPGPNGTPSSTTVASTRMPELVDATANPRHAVCANQGRILGLRDQYLKNHMANCLARPATR
jgi:rare lipoprotein A